MTNGVQFQYLKSITVWYIFPKWRPWSSKREKQSYGYIYTKEKDLALGICWCYVKRSIHGKVALIVDRATGAYNEAVRHNHTLTTLRLVWPIPGSRWKKSPLLQKKSLPPLPLKPWETCVKMESASWRVSRAWNAVFANSGVQRTQQILSASGTWLLSHPGRQLRTINQSVSSATNMNLRLKPDCSCSPASLA